MTTATTASMMSRMLLHIDWTRCDGHGSCAELLPDLLATDPWGYPVARGERVRGDVVVPADEVEHAQRAVSACPLLALRLHAST
jgi:ferredoxin